MNPLTSEWVHKAEGDYASARRERRARVQPNHDAACFHAQQCAEKYLKAVLEEAGIPFGKTHDLKTLLDLCVPAYPAWAALQLPLISLNVYAVAYRYPGSSATAAQAATAVQTVRKLRADFRAALALPP